MHDYQTAKTLRRFALLAQTELPTGRRLQSILIIDDDAELCQMMSRFLSTNGFRVISAHDGGTGLAQALQQQYDLVLLYMMLPVLDGLRVLEQLRRRSSIPVILLTARTGREDRIEGLEFGADYYVAKPFDPDELLATIRAVLRRANPANISRGVTITIHNFKLDTGTREVWKGNEFVQLTSIEFDILYMLMRFAGRVVSRDELSAVLNHRRSTPFEHSLEVHISHLRKKLEDARPVIRTVRGIGYLFVSSEDVKD